MKLVVLFITFLIQFVLYSQAQHESKLYHESNFWLVEPIQLNTITEGALSGNITLPQYNTIDKKSQASIIVFDSINHFADTLDAKILELDKSKKSDHVEFTLSCAFDKKTLEKTAKYFLLWNADVIVDLKYSVQKGDTIALESKVFKDPKNPDRKNIPPIGYEYKLRSNRKNIDRYFVIFNQKKHGKFTSSYLNSYAVETAQYFLGHKHGKEVFMESEDEVDKIKNWKFGVLHGPSENWYKGTLISSVKYKDGKRQGWAVTWRDDGVIRDSSFYESDIQEGKHTEFYKSGEKLKEYYYENGVKKGQYKSYHKNGHTAWQGSYENDKKHGYWYSFDENGKTLSFESFANGTSNKDKTELSNGYIIKSERDHYVPYNYPKYTDYFIVIDSCINLREVVNITDSLAPLFNDFKVKYTNPGHLKGSLKSNYYSVILVSEYTYDVPAFINKLEKIDFQLQNRPIVKITSKGVSEIYYNRLDIRSAYGTKQDLILIYQSEEDLEGYEGEDWGWFVNDVGEAISASNETFIWGSLSDYLSETEIKRIAVRQQMEGFGYLLYKGETNEMLFLHHDMPSSIIYGINEFFGTEIEMDY
jgi:antitoxin component YwqK of YwqJK toxin-antitoxin module